VEQFREILLEAVRARLHGSSGPVGLLVSGGLDSSSLACAAEHLVTTAGVSREVRLYSCIFQDVPGAQEQEFAESVAQRCRHASMTYLLCDNCWGLREFGDEQGRWLAEPEIGVSRALMLRPMRQARADGCRVVLSGIGGDQVLGGEPYHRPILLRDIGARRWLQELKHFRRYSRKGTARLLVDAWLRPSVPRRVRSFLRGRRRRDGSFPVHGDEVRNPLPPPMFADRSAAVAYGNVASGAFSARLSYLHMAAANAGVEHRLPFLDRRLVDFLLGLPPHLRFRDGVIKLVLRLALSEILPEKVRDRTSVAYFSALERRGLRQERSRIIELLTDSRVVQAGFESEYFLMMAWEDYWRNSETVSLPRFLVGFLCVEAWLRAWDGGASRLQGVPGRTLIPCHRQS
jgi:asparagine synthase (glutamine-hydrolysing)